MLCTLLKQKETNLLQTERYLFIVYNKVIHEKEMLAAGIEPATLR